MRTLTMGAALLAGLLTFAACSKDDNNTDNGNTISTQDRDFVTLVAQGNLGEISAGGIATLRGDSDAVRAFGTMMVTDHNKLQTDLKALTDSLSLTLPTAPDSAHVQLAARLATLNGHVFDTTYIGAQVRDHRATVAVLQTEIDNGTNDRLQALASRAMPAVQMHLQVADSLYAKLNY